MYYLLTFSQTGSRGNTLNANAITEDISPARWLSEMIQRFPDAETTLLYSIEINQNEFQALREYF